MITYSLWKFLTKDLDFSTDSEKIIYSDCIFFIIITIALDIITLPFQLIGLIIWLITRRKQ